MAGFGYCFVHLKRYREAFLCFAAAFDDMVAAGLEKNEAVGCLGNNMACCLYLGGKAASAFDYFQAADGLLSNLSSQKDPRRMTIRNNIERVLEHNLQLTVDDSSSFKFFFKPIENVNLNPPNGKKKVTKK